MTELIVFVLNNPHQLDEVLKAWVSCAVPGVTILASNGLKQTLGQPQLRDDLPLLPWLDDLLVSGYEQHYTLLAVVPAGFDVAALVASTELVTGKLNAPATGILFTVPVHQVWGLQRSA